MVEHSLWERGVRRFKSCLPDAMDAMELLQAIHDYRKTVGINQQELARKLQVETSTLSRWETGKTRPSLETFLLYVDAVGLELVVQPKVDDVEKILGRSGNNGDVSELGCL